MTFHHFAAACFLMCSCTLQNSPATPAAGESPEDFSMLLQQGASRTAVELTAALGQGYEHRKPGEIEAVKSSLSRDGEFKADSFGNRVYRVSKREEAARLLKNTWRNDRFLPGSELSQLFDRYPRASVAMMESDDQQILFFDGRDRLVAVYPATVQ